MPTFFWYPDDSTTLRLGVHVSTEDRDGGDPQAVRQGADSLHSFLEQNHTDRDYYQLMLTHKAAHQQTLALKHSIGYFYRSIGQTSGGAESLVSSGFSGAEVSAFTEGTYSTLAGAHNFVAGADLITDGFRPAAPHKNLGYAHNTVGVFARDDWALARSFTLEAGARGDVEHTLYFLPRLALLYKPLRDVSFRLGGGLAYKLPTVFNATDEEDAYQQVYAIAPSVQAERSASANLAVGYKGRIGDDLYFTADENFWTVDLMIQRGWGPWSLLLNVEDLTDTRQSRFGALYTGTRQAPVFKEVYAPLEGRVVSVALRYRL